MFFLCPVFVWLGWLLVCEHKFLVNILIYFFDLFLLSVLGPFIQQAAMEFLIPALTVSSYILRTEVKSTFLAGRKLKIRRLNERSVIQRCAPLSYLNRYLLCLAKLPAGASFPAGTAVTLCWCTQRPVHADWKVTVTPRWEEWWKIWLQDFPACGNLSSTLLGNRSYVEITEKLLISRETAKIRHLHLLMPLFTLPVPNALNGCSGSCTAAEPARLNAASWFPVHRWVKLCFYLLTIPS